MVPDGQKVRTDGQNGGMDGRQNYIPPTSSRDKKYFAYIFVELPVICVRRLEMVR